MAEIKKLKLEELNRISISQFKEITKKNICVVLDNVRSMHNVGSIFRTADAFLLNSIYLCGITPQPPHREIQKAALGATESVDWAYYKASIDVIIELKKQNYSIVGVEQTSGSVVISDFKIEPLGKYALVFGNEVDGIADELLAHIDHFIELPQEGTKHSLNVSICAGIVMWEFYKAL
jgi:23S rRNA (guanosine2251-2'-O)-methyltransferase